DELKLVPEARRGSRFVCSAAFVGPEGQQVFTASASGRVLRAPRGTGGFGYDPVFYYEPLEKTFAEMSGTEKTRVSHRGLAFAELAGWLKDQLL
ncbi:MAG TPA: non-canonical purine NTP pyrophosphatase, partial [Blastocatellia bacterium]